MSPISPPISPISRTFIAIEIDKKIREALRQIQEKLKTSRTKVKWSDPNNTHLTLKFLGEIEADLIERIGKVLPEIVREFKPFKIELDTIGGFPNLDRPRVIWLGIKEGKENLAKLNEQIEGKLIKLGIPGEKRKYHPHITVGRVRSLKDIEGLLQALKEKGDNSIFSFRTGSEWEAKEIVLFKSLLTPKGPIYTKLHIAPL